MGAILGLCSYHSALDVWLDKTTASQSTAACKALPARLGSFLEPFVVQEYEAVTGYRTHELSGPLHHPEFPELFGHLDRLVTVEGYAPRCVVLECKTCSAYRASEWGPSWSDQVPAAYLAQCLWYLGLAQLEEAHLAVLLGNTDLRVYRIKRDPDLERYMFDEAHCFWVEHVLAKRPPLPTTRAQVEALHPTPTVGLSHEASPQTIWAIERKSELEGALSLIQEEIDTLKNDIASAIGPAEQLTWQGRTVATWRLAKGTVRIDTERLRRERPDIVEHYTVQGATSRRLKFNTRNLQQTSTEHGS